MIEQVFRKAITLILNLNVHRYIPLIRVIQMCSGITDGRELNGELACTKISQVNSSAFI